LRRRFALEVGSVTIEPNERDRLRVGAQQVSGLNEKVSSLLGRMAEVEKVNARLESAALITARALQEISGHWDAVYEAMRREEERVDPVQDLHREQYGSSVPGAD
jgi:hypothetical protein